MNDYIIETHDLTKKYCVLYIFDCGLYPLRFCLFRSDRYFV